MSSGAGVVIRTTMTAPVVFTVLYLTGRLAMYLTDRLKIRWAMSTFFAGIEDGIRQAGEKRARELAPQIAREMAEQIIQEAARAAQSAQEAAEAAQQAAEDTALAAQQAVQAAAEAATQSEAERAAKARESEREQFRRFMRVQGLSEEQINTFFRQLSSQD